MVFHSEPVPMASISSLTTAASQSAEAGALPVSPFDLLAIFAAVSREKLLKAAHTRGPQHDSV